MDDKIDAVGKKVDEISGNLKWIGKTVIGAIILTVATFMVAGGFRVP